MGLSPEQAADRLRTRWPKSSNPSVRGLIDFYNGYRPESLVICEDRAWVFCVRPEQQTTAADWCLIAEPLEPNVVGERLKKRGFHDPLLAEFIGAFAGWREDYWPMDGHFIDAEELDGDFVLKIDDWLRTYEGIGWYEGSLVLYNARNGDQLLVHPSGRVGWLVGEERRATDYAASFAEFCEKYASYRTSFVPDRDSGKKIAWPFDSFGPPSH